MAISISDSVVINRPAGEVFAYLSDVKNDSKWQKGLAEAKFTSEGPVAVGATGVHRAKVIGITVEVGWELTEYEESRRTGWRFISGPFTGNESYTLESMARRDEFHARSRASAQRPPGSTPAYRGRHVREAVPEEPAEPEEDPRVSMTRAAQTPNKAHFA